MKQTNNTWKVRASTYAKNTYNPIRSIVENLKIEPNPEKPMIALSIGDPTVFGNLKPAVEVTEAVIASVKAGKYNGYAPSTGHTFAKEAVAKYCSTPESPLSANDIILCSGCSCALDLCITVLCCPGQNILIPRPGFAVYQTLAECLGASVKYYDLLPESNWEADLDNLKSQIDNKTVAIVVNNPSNPCGSVYNKQHLLHILEIAEQNRLPIIADEIYDNFVFEGEEFHWMASLSTDVPILSCGGLTKRFLVPGWRMGWVAIHDRNNIFGDEIRNGLQCLSQRIIGSNTIIQGALPTILESTPKEFFENTLKIVQDNAQLSYGILKRTKGLKPVMPQGAMYMMVGIDMACFPEFETDLQMVEAMICEESVFCLPGKCFNVTNFFRVVLTVPAEQMEVACERIEQFCNRHYKPVKENDFSLNFTNDVISDNQVDKYNSIQNGTNGSTIHEINFQENDEDLSLSKATLLRTEIIALEVEGE